MSVGEGEGCERPAASVRAASRQSVRPSKPNNERTNAQPTQPSLPTPHRVRTVQQRSAQLSACSVRTHSLTHSAQRSEEGRKEGAGERTNEANAVNSSFSHSLTHSLTHSGSALQRQVFACFRVVHSDVCLSVYLSVCLCVWSPVPFRSAPSLVRPLVH